jgi:hypothetical protein
VRRAAGAAGGALPLRATIEQQSRDGDRVRGHRVERQAGEAEVEQRIPPLGAHLVEHVAGVARHRARRAHPRTPLGRQLGPRSQRALDGHEVAADDGGMEAVVRDLGVTLEEPHRRVPRALVIREPTHVMVGARGFEKAVRERVRCSGRRGYDLQLTLERDPSGEPQLPGDRVLHVPKCGRRRGVRRGARQSGARFLVAGANGSEPALRFLLQPIEAGLGCGNLGHDTFLRERLASAE